MPRGRYFGERRGSPIMVYGGTRAVADDARSKLEAIVGHFASTCVAAPSSTVWRLI